MELSEYLLTIEKFIKDYLELSKMDGYVLGVSGGIDSALALAATVKSVGNNKIHCLILPCESNNDDLIDAVELCKQFDVTFDVIDLTSTYENLKNTLNEKENMSKLALSNIKVRLRMVTLYAIGQNRNSLVIGTDNMDELHVGYFTKYGDGASDLLPLAYLTKNEVRKASELYGINNKIITKIPSAGLFDDQSDEKDLGFTYDELDAYLLGKEVKKTTQDKIERLHRISAHKRDIIARPIPFKRG